MKKPQYQVILSGGDDNVRSSLTASLSDRSKEIGLPAGSMSIVDEVSFVAPLPIKIPTVVIFFGAYGAVVSSLVKQLMGESIVIIPIVSNVTQVSVEIPAELAHINALSVDAELNGLPRLTSLVFETFRLLRKERKLFISYRRKDSQPLADKLYDRLDAAGFDVFIDVRSVPPAVDFQEELWHRMADCDLVVLIDTPGFKESRWTTLELAQANLTSLQILHILFPDQEPDPDSSMSTFMTLTDADFRKGKSKQAGSVLKTTIDKICDRVEELRAQAMVWRHRYLVDAFCDHAADLGVEAIVQPERWISVRTPTGKSLAVIPAIGRPTSDRLKEIFESVKRSDLEPRSQWVIYDSRGMLKAWKEHLDWLDSHLPLRTLQVSDASIELKGYVK